MKTCAYISNYEVKTVDMVKMRNDINRILGNDTYISYELSPRPAFYIEVERENNQVTKCLRKHGFYLLYCR